MFKLPVCPYCKTVYDYKEVKNNKDTMIRCYHCKKEFERSTKNYKIPVVIVLLINFFINIMIFENSEILINSIIPVSMVSIIGVIIIFLSLPFFVKYKRK